jgi:hypothetical protein
MKYAKSGIVTVYALSALLAACNGGSTNPSVAQIQYNTLNYSGTLGSGGATGLTGIRGVANSSDVYITGSYYAESKNNGTLYVGPITGGGTYYVYNYPLSLATNVYSADNGTNGNVILTGSYTTIESGSYNFGFVYNGAVGNNLVESWITLDAVTALDGGHSSYGTVPHSVMGGVVVGNYETDSVASNGFVYNINSQQYESVSYPGARYTTIYGIWANGGDSYTVTGGYTTANNGILSVGFIADYNSSTGVFSNWTPYYYDNQTSSSILTHFEGITTDGNGGYNLAATGLEVENGESVVVAIAFVNVTRNSSGGFESNPNWINVPFYPGSNTSTADTVYENYMLGVYTTPGSSALNGYVATIPLSSY